MKLPDFNYFFTENQYKDEKFLPNDVIKNIYKTRSVEYEENGEIKMQKLSSQINPREGYYMYDIIKLNNYKNCLEVGMANGLSSLYICQALSELKMDKSKCISIDPFQSTQWGNAGVRNIEKAKLETFHSLMKNISLLAMTELIREVYDGKREAFDFIFIDGMHLFDYTLTDVFCADLLLRKGGVIIIDDYKHKGVNQVCDYLDKNYKHFKVHNNIPISTVRIYEKIGDDKRNWDFHKNVCN